MESTVMPELLGYSRKLCGPGPLHSVMHGKVAIVTGTSRGIGRAVAERLAAVGAQVVGIARSAEDLAAVEAWSDGMPGHVRAVAADLRDPDRASHVAHEILQTEGVPDLIVSNAGHSIRRYIWDYTARFHDIARTAGINYLGAVALLLPLVGPMMGQGSGHIISISTTSVDVHAPGWSAYGASKAAMEAWLASVGPELASRGVDVTSIHLPRVRTAMSAPTDGQYPAPELTIEQAADIVCGAIVRRPRLISPWWARLGLTATSAAPAVTHRLWTAALRKGVRP